MQENILLGLTRKTLNPKPPRNPGDTSPVAGRNRVIADLRGSDGKVKQHIDHWGNILVTNGLSRLAALVATGGEFSDQWVNAMQLGVGAGSEVSTQTELFSSTALVHLSQASFNISDEGPRTTRWLATFSGSESQPLGAAVIREVGIFYTTTFSTTMIARSELGTDSINQGASDVIEMTYDCVFTTA